MSLNQIKIQLIFSLTNSSVRKTISLLNLEFFFLQRHLSNLPFLVFHVIQLKLGSLGYLSFLKAK